jgi:hypothetical protein
MVTASMIPAFLAASAAAAREKAVLDAFGAVGADAPSRAVPLAEFPALDPDDLGRLIERGAVREGAPGTFYRYVPAPRARAADEARARLILWCLFAAGLAGIGVLLLLLSAKRPQ